jgi:hypothetical protein
VFDANGNHDKILDSSFEIQKVYDEVIDDSLKLQSGPAIIYAQGLDIRPYKQNEGSFQAPENSLQEISGKE